MSDKPSHPTVERSIGRAARQAIAHPGTRGRRGTPLSGQGPAAPAVTAADVRAAAARLARVVHRTPVMTSRALDRACGTQVFLKCENLQRIGAFKLRGAYNFIAQLTPEERQRGVTTFSSGNHAQGVALAARELGASAAIVMPKDAPEIKFAATRGYGADVVAIDWDTEDGHAVSARLARERGLTEVPPFDHPWIIAGQGTVGLELVEQMDGPLDLFLSPLGGGGLLAGCAIALRDAMPAVQLVGVETETANDWERSFAAGTPVTIPPPETVADGIRSRSPGLVTFPIVHRLVNGVRTVSDAEVIAALRFVLFRLKLLIEPSAAVPIALLLSGRLGDLAGKRVGVVISGGNVDPRRLGGYLLETDVASLSAGLRNAARLP